MLRRRRLRLAYLLGSLLLLAASLHAPTAYSAAGDPPAGSPAGAVYELPLQQGRAYGAPKGGGSAGVAGGRGETGSLYRTENNFGSSSRVPGLAVAGAGGAGRDGPGGAGATAGGAAGAGAAIAGGAVAGQVTDAGNTSISASIVLVGAIGLLAVAIGALSRRVSSGRSGS